MRRRAPRPPMPVPPQSGISAAAGHKRATTALEHACASMLGSNTASTHNRLMHPVDLLHLCHLNPPYNQIVRQSGEGIQ